MSSAACSAASRPCDGRSPQRQFEITQTSRAGRLTELPEFALGRGLSVRPALTAGGGLPAPDASLEGKFHPSLDVTKRIGSNLLTSLTINTDFAETEVDTRRTNLTRFPVFFPEKRTFFLEGTDLFSFGLGLEEDVIPFFSRRIGLVNGNEVPIIAGTKINGRIGNTNVGGLVVATDDEDGVVEEPAMMAVSRVKQNVGEESWLGAIVGVGDPLNRTGSWTAGADYTYSTSRFRGNKNLRAGVWGLATGRDDLLRHTRRSQRRGIHGRVSERRVGDGAHRQADRPGFRSIAGIRAANAPSCCTKRKAATAFAAQRPRCSS